MGSGGLSVWKKLLGITFILFYFLKQNIQVRIEPSFSVASASDIMGHTIAAYSIGGRVLGGSVAGLRVKTFHALLTGFCLEVWSGILSRAF